MPLKHDDPGEKVTVLHRWSNGLTWMAHPDATLQRASHALVDGDDVWLVDPLDAEGLDDELATFGTVAGVAVLSSRHGRHADRLARRHDVSIHVPAWFDGRNLDFDAPVETYNDELDGTGFEVLWRIDSSFQEAALFHPERRTLLVGDTLMTAVLTGEDGRLELGLPLMRLWPPAVDPESIAVDRVLVSHGKPVVDDARVALEGALGKEHRGTAAAILLNVPTLARIAYSSMRE